MTIQKLYLKFINDCCLHVSYFPCCAF